MLPYARRINFEQQLPTFSLATLYRIEREENLLSKDGKFFVHLSEKTPYLKELVRKAQDLNLTVDGDGTAPSRGGDITQATKGSIVTFGSSSRFDMNWIRRDEYACKKGVTPVYDVVKDWNKIEKALKQYAERKQAVRFQDGSNVTFHARFMVVDGKVVRYNQDEIAAYIPVYKLNNLVNNECFVIVCR